MTVARPNFYHPAPKIRMVSGVLHTPSRFHFDYYVGEPQALIAAGVIEGLHMLPAIGRKSIHWRPVGVPRAGCEEAPGYMVIERLARAYRVRLNVSEEERLRRDAYRRFMKSLLHTNVEGV